MEIEIGRGKTARRAYGLNEIAIVPSRRTRDPEDIDISWSLGDLHLDLPCLASALDAAVDPATAGVIGSLGGPRRPQPGGLADEVRGPGAGLRGDSEPARDEGHEGHAGHLRRAHQGGVDLPPRAGDQGPWRHSRGLPHAAAGRALPQGRHGGRPRRARRPGHGRLGRARLDQGRAAEPDGVRALAQRARRRRWLRELLDRAPPYAHRRRRGTRRRGAGPHLHDAGRDRGRGAAGHRGRRRRRRPDAPLPGDRRVRQRHRRRRDAHGRGRGPRHRLRRGRRDARQRLREGGGGAGARLLVGDGDLPPDPPARHPHKHQDHWARWRRSWSVRPTRTTAHST